MAKKGSASATIGLDYSAFESGSKAVMKCCEQMGSFIKNTLAVAAGNILSAAFAKGANALSSFFSAMKDNLVNIFTAGEQMANLAHATGMAAGQYMQFVTAAEKGVTFSEAGKLLGKNADIMTRDAGMFRDISLKLYAVGERIQGFWLGVADKIAPVINPLLDRLVALDLSGWGQAFAEPIANAVKIIYQLAADGKLWQTMGEFAAAAFTYAAEVLGKLIGVYSNAGFSEAMSKMWASIKEFGGFLYETLLSSVSRVLEYFSLGLIMAANKVASIMDKAAVFFGLMDQEQADSNQEQRTGAEEGVAKGIASDTTLPETRSVPIGQQLADALKDVKFGTPELITTLTDALSKFDLTTSKGSDKYSNQSAVQNFGVSSMAAVGGGGGVGMTSLADHAAKQSDYQRDLRDDVRELKAALTGRSEPAKPTTNNQPVTIR